MGITLKMSATSPLRVLIGFNSGDYQEISLSTWLAANPDAVVADNFKVDDSLVAKPPQETGFHRLEGRARHLKGMQPCLSATQRPGQDQP